MHAVIDTLNRLGIDYVRYDHPPIRTVEEGARLCPVMPGLHFKNLFIKDKKTGKLYLVVIEENRKFDFKAAKKWTDWKNPTFANEELLFKYLGLTPGAVSPFGLINNKEHDVILLLDKLFLTEPDDTLVHFHPNVNTATIGVRKADFLQFLNTCGNELHFEQ